MSDPDAVPFDFADVPWGVIRLATVAFMQQLGPGDLPAMGSDKQEALARDAGLTTAQYADSVRWLAAYHVAQGGGGR